MKQRICIDKVAPNAGALDFSWLLDAPAGKHGFARVKEGHLYFEDGARARFMGFNMPTRSCMPDHLTADRLAKRFASLGVNVIRLHAADAPAGESGWCANPDYPLIDYSSGSSRNLNARGLDRYDYFMAALKSAGIYVHVDLLVARAFMPGDELDYPHAPPTNKCFSLFNARLIELQKEYARKLLCHVNPYTGLRLIDDPAVMTIEITNENSVFSGTQEFKAHPGAIPYREELKRRFNSFLQNKYSDRAALKSAWTHNGECALDADEDPAQNTVRCVEGSFYQVMCDPMGAWAGIDGAPAPARYADFLEFGMQVNRSYYSEMVEYIRSLGAKAPLATGDLLTGAALAFSHTGGDVMENHMYFNHPLMPVTDKIIAPDRREAVSSNPLTMQANNVFMRTDLLTLAAPAEMRDMPMIVSEWNEYGTHPFHSTSYGMLTAYACLHDWDGLILYCYCTSDASFDQPGDEIRVIFDAFNDPALICQFGCLSAMFLKGLVKPSARTAEIAFSEADTVSLPPAFRMPYAYLSYVMNVKNALTPRGEKYRGNADVTLSAGCFDALDLSSAKRAVHYAWSPYTDAFRTSMRAARAPDDARALIIDDIRALAGGGDYTAFARMLDAALKKWGVLPEDAGYLNGALVSDTREIRFDPDNAQFSIITPYCVYFSGAPKARVRLTRDISVTLNNPRATIAFLPLDLRPLSDARRYLITLIGETGMDDTREITDGFLTTLELKGKLYADTPEGTLYVDRPACLSALDTRGIPIETRRARGAISLAGAPASVNFLLELE